MKPTDSRCRHLRSKAMFIPGQTQPEQSASESLNQDASHYWCNCTLSETGPDDRSVGAQVCQPSRPCFED